VCHVFHTRKKTYTELPITLPDIRWCVASFVQDDLILETGYTRLRWRPGEELQTYTVQDRNEMSWANMNTITCNGGIYVSVFPQNVVVVCPADPAVDEQKELGSYEREC